MKHFSLFHGDSGELGTHDVTEKSEFTLVIETVKQLRDRMLTEQVLRDPFTLFSIFSPPSLTTKRTFKTV
jgi:hypothetical protein